jgi:alkanesulfonate monooxygenase SsuD/methylene tetrahydromethanopterin reductase-like flavin-dependent oxidoreductase (luciferase family)
VIVERWNGIPFEAPYRRVKDTLLFLRRALAGEKVEERYASFDVRGFRLQMMPLAVQPPLLVAALREGMLRLAGRHGDGAISTGCRPGTCGGGADRPRGRSRASRS